MAHQTGTNRRLIGVSLGARTTAEAELALQEIARLADIAEIRLDFMVEYDLPRLLGNRPCPVIVTNRPEREGGRYRGSEDERVQPLLQAIELGAEYVDIEHDSAHLIADRQNTQLIISYHDFDKTPENFVQIHRDVAAKGADVVKIVGMAQRVTDNLRVFDALAQSSLPTIAIAMGEPGLISRVLALRYDTCLLTYATLGTGERVAPGQLDVSTMRQVFQAEKIGGQTSVFAILAPAGPSEELIASLNVATREAGVDGVWVPFVVPATADDAVADAVRAYRRLPIAGYLVLDSAQTEVIPALDAVESRSPDGGVNVVCSIDGRLVGSWAPSSAAAFVRLTGARALRSGIPAQF